MLIMHVPGLQIASVLPTMILRFLRQVHHLRHRLLPLLATLIHLGLTLIDVLAGGLHEFAGSCPIHSRILLPKTLVHGDTLGYAGEIRFVFVRLLIIKLCQVQVVAPLGHGLIICISHNLLAHLLLLRRNLRAARIRLLVLMYLNFILTFILDMNSKILHTTFRRRIYTNLDNFRHFPYKLLHLF